MTHLGRKTLPHTIPSWIDPIEHAYFITIVCRPRSLNHLCRAPVGEALLASARYYYEQGKWFPLILVLMPDHLHMLTSFNRDLQIKNVVTAWKRYAATKLGISWQDGFFEHRLRSDESREAKAEYIRQNPVRAGLVADAEEWPYSWAPN